MNEMREMYDMKMKWRDMKHTKKHEANETKWNETKQHELK